MQQKPFFNYLNNPGYMGWLKAPCSQCGKTHPANCGIVNDPVWSVAYAAFEDKWRKRNARIEKGAQC